MALISFPKSSLLILLALVPSCQGSKRQVRFGDKATFTQMCVRNCLKDYEDYLTDGNKPDPVGQCNINLDLGRGEWDPKAAVYSEAESDKTTPPPGYFDSPAVLEALQWDCKSLCNYSCFQSHARRSANEKKIPIKYAEKWPFVRVFGVEEFMSFLACLLNGLIHIYYLTSNKLRPLFVGPEGYRMKTPMIIYSVVCLNSYLWSAFYFISSNKRTETMDLFFAFFKSIITTWVTVYRIGGSGAGENAFGNTCAFISLAALAPFLFIFAFYVYLMTSFTFNPMMSMRLQLAFMGLHVIMWVYWSLIGRGRGKGYRWKGLACLFFLNLITFIEVVLGWDIDDFPPYFGLFDNKSIWLLFTVPLTSLWYSFLMNDTKWEVDAMEKKKK